jgi:hypothetical protein
LIIRFKVRLERGYNSSRLQGQFKSAIRGGDQLVKAHHRASAAEAILWPISV